MIQTGLGKAELRIGDAPDHVLSLGENTSVQIDSLDRGKLSVELFYGRILLKSAAGAVIVRSGNSILSLEGDGAVDFVVRPGLLQPALTAHCFRGRGELFPLAGNAGEGEPARLSLEAGESLGIEYRSPFVYVERKSVDSRALLYWNVDGAFAPVPAVKEAPVEVPAALRSAAPPRPETLRRKNGNIAAGLFFMLAGAAMQGYCFFAAPGEPWENPLSFGSYGALGLGVFFFIGAAAYNPVDP
jgi:hypothetical protein